MERRPLSKRVRFEIFKRDGFRCLYCGATPLQSALHVDHVQPVADGGSDDPSNLVTSCDACNLGKGAVRLNDRAFVPAIASEAQRDRADQILEYLAIQKGITDARSKVIALVSQYWSEASCSRMGDSGGIPNVIKPKLPGLIDQWPIEKLVEAIDIATSKGLDGLNEVKYFYGILRRWRERQVATEPPRPLHEEDGAERQRRENEVQHEALLQDWDEAIVYDNGFGPRHLKLALIRAASAETEWDRLLRCWKRDGMLIDGHEWPDDTPDPDADNEPDDADDRESEAS